MSFASRSNRSVNCSTETLSATSRSSRVSRARYTSPIPPAPIFPTISCGPSVSHAESDMTCRLVKRIFCNNEQHVLNSRHSQKEGKKMRAEVCLMLIALLPVSCTTTRSAPAGSADPLAEAAQNVKLVGYHDLQGRTALVVTTK